MAFTIILIRHGRSRHAQTGWLNRNDFLLWREAYEAAGVDPQNVPPPALRSLDETSRIVVASTAPRAVESARLLTEGEVQVSPLLNELDLAPPGLQNFRLPMAGWALMYGLRWTMRTALRRAHVTADEMERVGAASEWLENLALQNGSVAAVTHYSFRALLGRSLIRNGWRPDVTRPGMRHWSAWSFTRSKSRAGGPATSN